MLYELDISGINNARNYSERVLNFKLPLETGVNHLNYDLIECDVPKDIFQELVSKAVSNGDVEAFKVGFDHIPVGASLKRIK
jgi:hypothetical protein